MISDYHMHTYFSDDCDETIDRIVANALERGLDEICITDHVDYGVKLDKEDWELSDKSMMMNVDYDNYFPYLHDTMFLALWMEQYPLPKGQNGDSLF